MGLLLLLLLLIRPYEFLTFYEFMFAVQTAPILGQWHSFKMTPPLCDTRLLSEKQALASHIVRGGRLIWFQFSPCLGISYFFQEFWLLLVETGHQVCSLAGVSGLPGANSDWSLEIHECAHKYPRTYAHNHVHRHVKRFT